MGVYRVWHNRRMIYPSEYRAVQDCYTGQVELEVLLSDGVYIRVDRTHTMRYVMTLLNGMPLYEEDIIDYTVKGQKKRGVVRTHLFSVVAVPNDGTEPTLLFRVAGSAELVGNTYETPDWIQSPKEDKAEISAEGTEKDTTKPQERCIIYTDGCCLSNPGGAGGWAYILTRGKKQTEGSGRLPECTNNIAELTAAIMALRATEPGSEVTLFSDSQYVVYGFSQGRVENWKKSGWKNGTVKNQALWEELDRLQSARRVEWRWVRGHSSNDYNNRCDLLANRAAACMN